MTTAQTGGNVSQSITITTEQLQQMIQAATDHALAAALQAAGAQVADVGATSVAGQTEDPRITAIREITQPVTRSLRWVSISYRADQSKIQIYLMHTAKGYTPHHWSGQIHTVKIDMDDPGHLDRVRAACDLAGNINDKIHELLDRLLGDPAPGAAEHAKDTTNGAPFGLFGNWNGGRHD